MNSRKQLWATGPDPAGPQPAPSRAARLVRRVRPSGGRRNHEGARTTSPLTPAQVFEAALDKAVQVPSSVIREHVNRIQGRNPLASPERVIHILEREYLRVIQATGGAVGVAAAIPSVGTGVGVALTGSNVATFLAASAAFTLGVADVHGIEVTDTGRRRALLLAALLGDKAFTPAAPRSELLAPGAEAAPRGPEGDLDLAALGASSAFWGRTLLTTMPTNTIKQVNRVLAGRYVRFLVAREGTLAIGRLAPFGIGAGVGVLGARALGSRVIGQARGAFGPAPYEFGVPVRVVETGGSPLLVPHPENL